MLACSAPFLAFDACAPEHAGTVLVTGGSSGLGMVAARMLAQQGLKVIIASRSEVRAPEAGAGRASGGTCYSLREQSRF